MTSPTAAGARPSLRKGSEIELTIADLAYGGRGVARHEGLVVFVEGGLPGDRLKARVTRTRRGFAEARAVQLIAPGADRVEESCIHAHGPCPGAPWQALRYERQLEHKERQVDEALRRIGRLDGYRLEPIIPAVERWRYRNKMEYSFGERDGRLVAGFHERGEWRLVDDVEDCLLASEASNAIRTFVRDWCAAERLRAYDRETGTGLLRNLVVREGRRTGQLQVRLVTAAPPDDAVAAAFADRLSERFAGIASLVWSVNPGAAEVSHGTEDVLLAGEEWIEEGLAELRLRISADAFFQTNTEMAEQLVATARELARADAPADGLSGAAAPAATPAAGRAAGRLFDLYCGIGTIGLALAGDFAEVWGIDVVEEAIARAIENAALNGIGNAHFFAGNARTAVRPLVERAGQADVAVVDPPRAGLSQKVVRRVLETGAVRIVYVSCNPTTLAPNARQLVDAGYRLVKVRPVDMFPQTPHIECVALFERS